MMKWTKPAVAIMAVAAMTQVASARSDDDKMAMHMGKAKTYTGCIEAGPSTGTFVLTHAVAGMDKDAMRKDEMKTDTMKKDAMGKDAMAPASLAISSTAIDLSKHVGHKVSVTGGASAMGKGMATHDEMDKTLPALSVTSITMIATTCGM